MLIKFEVATIEAVRNLVLSHPLCCFASSPSSDLCHLCDVTQIYLNPLPLFQVQSWPRSCFAVSCHVIKPSIGSSMSCVILKIQYVNFKAQTLLLLREPRKVACCRLGEWKKKNKQNKTERERKTEAWLGFLARLQQPRAWNRPHTNVILNSFSQVRS